MKRFGVGVALAMVIGASLSLVAMGGAYAVTRPACKKVSGKISGTITISSCAPTNAQYLSASGLATKLASGGTITWSPSKKTTVFKSSAKQTGTGCKAPAKEYDVSGIVTGGTATYTHKGDIVKGRACINLTLGTVSLVPNTALTL